jgi:uncharacterized lipoprotein
MRILLTFWFCIFLVGCATEDSRYKDNANLERPPEIPIDKQAAGQNAANEIEQPVRRRHGKGLKSDVYIPEGSHSELKIKRSFDESWSLLNQVIQNNELKITDQDRSKGALYVSYDGGGLLSGASSFFGTGNKRTYLLMVEPQNEETRLTVSLAGKNEDTDSGNLKDGIANKPAEDNSAKLLELIYDTLHDSVKDE